MPNSPKKCAPTGSVGYAPGAPGERAFEGEGFVWQLVLPLVGVGDRDRFADSDVLDPCHTHKYKAKHTHTHTRIMDRVRVRAEVPKMKPIDTPKSTIVKCSFSRTSQHQTICLCVSEGSLAQRGTW